VCPRSSSEDQAARPNQPGAKRHRGGLILGQQVNTRRTVSCTAPRLRALRTLGEYLQLLQVIQDRRIQGRAERHAAIRRDRCGPASVVCGDLMLQLRVLRTPVSTLRDEDPAIRMERIASSRTWSVTHQLPRASLGDICRRRVYK
jgi:hypothetical protein